MKLFKTITIVFILAFLVVPNFSAADVANSRFSGRIFLQVEGRGEAWYVNPVNLQRYYLERPSDMFAVMRRLGMGISNSNLKKIPTQKNGIGVDVSLVNRLRGRILLQVESKGEAWYVSPSDGLRYYLGSPSEALALVRRLGQGIKNIDLYTIRQADGFGLIGDSVAIRPVPISNTDYGNSEYDLSELEKSIFAGVNAERITNGLTALKWNEDLALAARMHSQSLWRENQPLTGLGKSCDFPMIHHEGLEFGLMSNNRLEYNGVYYFEKNGENIALITASRIKVSYSKGDPAGADLAACSALRDSFDVPLKARLEEETNDLQKEIIIKAEIMERAAKFQSMSSVDVEEVNWASKEQVVTETVQGWMNSPGHRRNILTPEYDEAGMGVVIVNGYVISTQVFIKRASCGYKGGACCVKPSYYPYCYQPYSCGVGICG